MQSNKKDKKYKIKEYPDVLYEVNQMSIEELLRCVICPDLQYGMVPDHITPATFLHTTTSKKAAEMSVKINGQAARPSLIVADMEYGAGNAVEGAVKFPSMRAAAVTGEEQLAYKMGEYAAKEAINAGYHWTFGPCVDIVGNKENPIVGLRTAGSDADTVIAYGGAYMEGLQDHGLIATLKHFPGDGYSPDDQHITTTENPLSRKEWDDTFGRVYGDLINRGVKAIMPGHIALPAYDEPDARTGLYPPATVSKNLLSGLLREKLGFEGIIVSDAVNMSGFCGYMNLYHACAAFLEAGGDCILFMHETKEYLEAMKRCLEKKYLTMEVLKNRAYRMLCFAREYFEEHPNGLQVPFERENAEKTAAEMTDKAVKVIRDRAGLIPLEINSDTRIAHVILHNSWVKECNVAEEVTDKLRNIADIIDEFRDPGPEKMLELAISKKYDLILCSIIEKPDYALNTAKLCGPVARNMMNGWMRYGTPTVFVGYDTLQFAETYKASVDTMIYTHGITKYTADAVISRLTQISSF